MNCCARTSHVSVSFSGHTVLHDVSIDFPSRAVTVLLGRSGSGKTTLLRSFNRLNEHFPGCRTEGVVEVKTGGVLRPVSGAGALMPEELRRRAGMVFQSPNPLPLSIRKNIMLPLALVSRVRGSEAEDLMKKALTDAALWDEVAPRLDEPASTLSGGQQQRLCLARTLALQPDLLLLDEPTASLDRKAAEQIEDLILSLKERYSVIMVSHSLSQARKLASQAVVLCGGRLKHVFQGDELPQGNDAEGFLEKFL
ncbi:MAG: phosphate ABC transporter ATP-binding protein [Pyramidobacter sp.]|nr:phosphate ABC transporter ATP-binding protein [Pyramidobacter sp.]